jgi:hypothetical protein
MLTSKQMREQSLRKLFQDMSNYRRSLSPGELVSFDRRWGNQLLGSVNSFPHRTRRASSRSAVLKLRPDVQEAVMNRDITAADLSLRMDGQTALVIGVELIRLFVIDVLTQHDVRSARVFARKTRTDFRNSWVVQDWMKLLAVLVLVALCLSMLYVVASYAVVKGQSFVVRWLVVFSTTLIVDVGVRQTIETVVIYYTIPDLVASQVESVEAALRRQAQALVMKEECKPKGSFSCPYYLFVSSALARERPDLVESQIILRFQGTTPDEICVINDKSALGAARFEASVLAGSKTGIPFGGSEVGVNRRRWRWLRRLRQCFSGATAAAVLTSLLLHIGSLSTDLQRIVISFLLPMIIGGVMFVFDTLFNSGFLITVSFFVGITVFATSYAIYRKNARLRAVIATVSAAAGATTPSMRQKTRLSTRSSIVGSQSRLSLRQSSRRIDVQSSTTSSHLGSAEAQSNSAVARKTGGSVRGIKQSEAALRFADDRLVAVEEDCNTDKSESASSGDTTCSHSDEETSSSESETDLSSSSEDADEDTTSSSEEEASLSDKGSAPPSSEGAPVHETQWRSGEALSDIEASSEDETLSEESSDAETEADFFSGSKVGATKGASRQQAVLVQQCGSSLHATLATAGSVDEDSAPDDDDDENDDDEDDSEVAGTGFIGGFRGCASDSSSDRSIEYVDVG